MGGSDIFSVKHLAAVHIIDELRVPDHGTPLIVFVRALRLSKTCMILDTSEDIACVRPLWLPTDYPDNILHQLLFHPIVHHQPGSSE